MSRPVDPPAHLATAFDAFREAVADTPDKDYLCIPARPGRDYYPEGIDYTYAQAAAEAERWRARLAAAGFGHGHRIAAMLGNQPEHFHLFMATNALGVMLVPLGQDQTVPEIVHVLNDCDPDLILTVATSREKLDRALSETKGQPPLHTIDALPDQFAPPRGPALPGAPGRDTDTLLLYTSGTTGLPKGCRVTNDYFLHSGQWYASRGHALEMRQGEERLFNPFPMFHINAAVVALMAMILTRGCMISVDRFSARSWWDDIVASRATIMHYMGVIPPILVNAQPCEAEKHHQLRFAMGAGVAPPIHKAFEARFGFPMVEVWAMTETGRLLTDHVEPRSVDVRAVGRPEVGFEVRIVDGDDNEVPQGEIGELTVRHTAAEPRKGFFAGYLNHPDLTEAAWRGGWFHSGDVVRQQADGTMIFVDRTKNIIRRSGENISAGEVEAVLATHADVKTVAVLAIPDDMRDEEVMACVVLNPGAAKDAATAEALLAHCREKLAYFKLPAWVLFRDQLPTTSTNKIQHRLILEPGAAPDTLADCFDLRAQKAAARLG